jgi:protein O-GlcNAcase/histone acetyltransferase
MAKAETADFLAGVIEGFYGQPWSQAERFELFNWMAAWGLNTYFYAPKDDLKHRAIWREPYSRDEAASLGKLIRACKERDLYFIYALSPGLDIRYSNEADQTQLKKRFEQLLALGCRHFSLLFDDIPDRLDRADLRRWGSLASAQCHVTNAIFRWLRQRSPGGRFLFCPTPYCGRMAEAKLGGERYLRTIGRELSPEIDVFWTGPEIISREITVAHVREIGNVLRRKPLIWDNLHANDYDGRRFFCGPYAGRPPALRKAVSGLLSNPNCEFPLNFVPLRTLAKFVNCTGAWNARKAYLAALREWLPAFETVGQPVTREDLVLFGDCYYLPHEEGPEAEGLYQQAKRLLAGNPPNRRGQVAAFRKQAARLRQLCARMTELRQRPLFYALSRRVWELREELDLLERYVAFKSKSRNAALPFNSDFHLPGTDRGGLVPRLQRLLVQQPDGTLAPDQKRILALTPRRIRLPMSG